MHRKLFGGRELTGPTGGANNCPLGLLAGFKGCGHPAEEG